MAEPQSTLVPSKTGSPGERILKIQADLLRKEKFLEVLDAETVNSWQVNWAVLEDLEIPLADPRKTSSMRYVFSHLKIYSQKATSDQFFKLYS